MAEKKYYIGPAGWSYPDWKGIVYPRDMKVHPLNFLEQYFGMVEINTTFYNVPNLKMVENWCRTPVKKDFLFILKLNQKFTHIREEITPQEVEASRNVFGTVKYHERLAGILLQFPWSFINIGQNMDHLKQVIEYFRDFPLIVEVRHISWHKREFFEFLNKNGIAFCNIDQPETANSIKLSDYVTSDIGYLRLHGRNRKDWFGGHTDRNKRYNYLYNESELGELTAKIRSIHEKSLKTFIVGNNHFKGQAVANLLQISSLLSGRKVPAPELLADHYPDLK